MGRLLSPYPPPSAVSTEQLTSPATFLGAKLLFERVSLSVTHSAITLSLNFFLFALGLSQYRLKK